MAFDLRDVAYYLRVAQLGHVGRSAESLGLTQPAVTKAIARLERELGLRLFERTAHGVVPTAAGDAFRVRAERIHAEYEDAMTMAGDLRAGLAGRLRVGASGVAADTYVTPALAQLLDRRPRMRVELTIRLSTELLAALRAGALDVAVAPDPGVSEPDLVPVPVGADEMVVVAAQRHPLFRRARPTLADLAHERWILPREPLALRRRFADVFARAGLPGPEAAVEVDVGSPQALALAASTHLLTLAAVPRRPRGWGVAVRPIEIPELAVTRRFCAFVRRDGHRSPLLEGFLEAVRSVAPGAERAPAITR